MDEMDKAHEHYNLIRARTDAEPTTMGDINFWNDYDENIKGGYPEYEKRMIRGIQ